MYSQMQLLADMFYPPLLFVKPSMLTKMVHGALRGATGASNGKCIHFSSGVYYVFVINHGNRDTHGNVR